MGLESCAFSNTSDHSTRQPNFSMSCLSLWLAQKWHAQTVTLKIRMGISCKPSPCVAQKSE